MIGILTVRINKLTLEWVVLTLTPPSARVQFRDFLKKKIPKVHILMIVSILKVSTLAKR